MCLFQSNKIDNMKMILSIFAILILSYSTQRDQKLPSIRGIWIPQKIDWRDGDFYTYYFPGDSSVVIIASVQKKIRDSIVFGTEPGFNIRKGKIRPISGTQFAISGKTIYRFIKLTGKNADETFEDTVTIGYKNGTQSVKINGTVYQKGGLYRNESKERIVSIATKMAPEIEKHPEKFE